ncbi:hypothetical protein Hanom_Chr16g01488121 [Helianthus anomalus]
MHKSPFQMEDIVVVWISELLLHLKKLQVHFHNFFTFRKCKKLAPRYQTRFTLNCFGNHWHPMVKSI